MPNIPYPIYGTIKNSSNATISNVRITIANITSSSGSLTSYSNYEGKFILDLANLGYTDGDNISYETYDEFLNEEFSGTFIVSGINYNLNVSLALISEAKDLPSNRATQIYNIGGKTVSLDNPFPVRLMNYNEIDTANNPNYEWSIRSDGQPNYIDMFIGEKVYRKTYTYTSNIRTKESKWIRKS